MADDNNQDAPAATETPVDNAAATIDSPDAVGTQPGTESTTQNPPVAAAPTFDPKTSYDSLVKQLESVNKNYGNLRSEYTRRTQYEAQLKAQLDSLHKAFTQATKQEISPEEFMKSLQTQGVKAFDPLRDEWTKELKTEHEKALETRDQEITGLKTNFEIMRREIDVTNYPDFAKLKPVMNEIASSENCPVDWNQDVGVIYDTLYKLARDLKAEESVKQAHELGRKSADAQAAKESASAVAAGGKTNTTGLDTRKMSAAQLKQHFAKLGMVSD
jgi:hypothetical protein